VVEIRFITGDEVIDFRRAITAGFGGDEPDDLQVAERFLDLHPPETPIAAFDRGRIVATFSSFDLDMTVPGSSLPTAGTTAVTVSPTHRRRGILTEMMTMHLRQAIERDQAMAALWASEEKIYGRFGYGYAAGGLHIIIPAANVSLPTGPDDVEIVPIGPGQAVELLPPVFERFVARTPGSFARWPGWWRQRHFHDPERRRPPGTTTRRHVVAERAGAAAGYAVYRQESKWTSDGAEGTVHVVELVADDDGVRRALWHFLSTVDLFPMVEHWNAPVDDPVLIEADRFRALRTAWRDSLWLRLLDVRTALQARRYEHDGALVLDVADRYLDRGGRFELVVDEGAARCRPVTATADVELDIAELSALYLGGRSADRLARADRIGGSAAGIEALDRIFRTTTAPYCIEVF